MHTNQSNPVAEADTSGQHDREASCDALMSPNAGGSVVSREPGAVASRQARQQINRAYSITYVYRCGDDAQDEHDRSKWHHEYEYHCEVEFNAKRYPDGWQIDDIAVRLNNVSIGAPPSYLARATMFDSGPEWLAYKAEVEAWIVHELEDEVVIGGLFSKAAIKAVSDGNNAADIWESTRSNE